MKIIKSIIKTEITYDDEMKNKYVVKRMGQEQKKSTHFDEKCGFNR